MSSDGPNIHPIPLRLDLPAEIAALAIPQDAEPLVILNANEKDLRATYNTLRFGTLLPALWAWIAEQGRWMREHETVTAAVAASISAAALATSTQLALDGDGTPMMRPAPTVTVATSPSPDRTLPMPSSSRPTGPAISPTRMSPPASTSKPPSEREEPTPEPASARPSRPATLVEPTSSGATTPPTREPSRGTLEIPLPEIPAPEIPSVPPLTSLVPEVPPATAGADCRLRVDVDPLVDVCVLS